jgi:Reverse transcriptase (RNA-dependent DNA polymerase)
MKLPLVSYDWAIKHLVAEGDTDLFPVQFEIEALKYLWPSLRKEFANLDVTNYAWRGGRRFVVPKRMLSFRVATQLDPVDSLVFAALIHKYGPSLERNRLPAAEGRIFSYRFFPSAAGHFYADSPSWHDFWEASLAKASRPSCSHVVVVDIADFYNQVYHHVIERQLTAAGLVQPVAKVIKRFLQTLTDKVSRGIPVGPHSAHILAECALDPTDRSLLSHGYDFCRYVDDIHVFVQNEAEAMGAIYNLAQILDNQQRLILQNEKTRVLTANDFAAIARSMLIDRPANEKEAAILALIGSKTGGDRYREISLKDLSLAELKVVSQDVLDDLLSHYLSEPAVDYPRLSWLLRRLTQVGAPGGVEFVLAQMGQLSPILGPAMRYLMAAVPNVTGDKKTIGKKVLAALDLPVIQKSPYLQMILLNVLATLPELDHVDPVTALYPAADPAVRREILCVAGAGARADWLRDRKAEYRGMDVWARRAFVYASRALPREEADFWIQSVRDIMSPIEKVVARHAFRDKELKLGNIEIAKL